MVVRPDGSGLRQIELPTSRPECPNVFFQYPTAMRDGRLGLQQACNVPGRPFGNELVAYDVDARSVVALTPPLDHFHAASFSWAPDGSRALAAQSSHICASFAEVDAGGLHPLSITLGSGDRKWNLQNEFHRVIGEQTCTRDGLADHPVFSPDGKHVAFFASPDAIGESGDARLDVEWGLWLMGADGSHPRPIVTGLVEPNSVAWSPDSQWLAFNVRRGPRKGIWLYSLTTKARVKISGEDGVSVNWSPDGRQLLSLRQVREPTSDEAIPPTEFVIWDVAPLLSR